MESSFSNFSPEKPAPARFYQHRRMRTICLGLLVAALWLSTRPYTGITGDSELYTVQALNHLMPGRFAKDLYFQYGSQDQFTIFSFIYAPFLAAFGLAAGNLILMILGQCCWLSGLFFLAWSLFRDKRIMLLGVVAALVLPDNPALILTGEPILTPRLFAESLSFYAIGSMLAGRSGRALILLFLSLIIHPLMTLPGLAVLFLYEAIKRPYLWLVLALTMVAVLELANFGVQPFSRMFNSFDSVWLAVVRVPDRHCFLTQWDLLTWFYLCNIFALAGLGYVFADNRERRFLGAVIFVVLVSLAVSLVGGDVLHNVLIVDAQAWRATYLLAVVAKLFMGAVILRIRKRGQSLLANAVFLLALELVLFALSGFLASLSLLATPLAIFTWLVTNWENRNDSALPILLRILVSICAVLIIVKALSFLCLAIASTLDTPVFLLQICRDLSLRFIISTIIGIFLIESAKIGRKILRPALLLSLSIILVVLPVCDWDQESPWTRFVDTTTKPPAALTALLPGDSPIYWEGDVTAPWFLLKRSSYFSCDQGTGALFSRGTAINYQLRYESLKPLAILYFGSVTSCAPTDDHAAASFNRAALSAICKTDSGLGALVLIKPAMDDPGEVWVSPVDFEYEKKVGVENLMFTTNRFYIYRCSNL